jgi:multidrug resistance efflux pump
MTWANRFRMLMGMLLVLVIVAAGTLLFTQRQNRATSATGTIVAESFPVGTDYGGIVTRQYVDVGEEVAAGDPLFDVHSLQLRRDIVSGYVSDPTVLAGIDQDGTSTVVATVGGTMASVAVPQGGFAAAGGLIAAIDRAESLYVEAEFILTARDYARIAQGAEAEVLLPSQDVLTGAVTRIDVDTVEGQALSTVRIESPRLTEATANGLFQPGTPVSVTIQLRDDGPLAGVADSFRDLLHKVGL